MAEKTAESLNIYMKEGVTEIHTSFEMMVDGRGKTHIRNPGTNTPQSIDRMVMVNPRMELVTVRDSRFGDQFDPPEMHLTRPIVDRSPPAVAGMAIRYFDVMLEEALKLPTHI